MRNINDFHKELNEITSVCWGLNVSKGDLKNCYSMMHANIMQLLETTPEEQMRLINPKVIDSMKGVAKDIFAKSTPEYQQLVQEHKANKGERPTIATHEHKGALSLQDFFAEVRKLTTDIANLKTQPPVHAEFYYETIHSNLTTLIEQLTDEQKAEISPVYLKAFVALGKDVFQFTSKSYQEECKSYVEMLRENRSKLVKKSNQ